MAWWVWYKTREGGMFLSPFPSFDDALEFAQVTREKRRFASAPAFAGSYKEAYSMLVGGNLGRY